MKKIIYIFALAVAFIGCKKEAELPELDFKFSVIASQENFSDKGVNESVKIDFDISMDYDFTKVPMKYKIESTGENSISDGNKKILPNDVYTLTEPKLSLIYTGKNKGEHKVKITFTNQKKSLVKEFSLNYKEYGYKLEVLNGNNNPHQGENVDFDLKITPENTKITDYFIIFKSYDAEDPNLEKSLVALNGKKIIFNKEYKIEDLSKIKIRLNSFYIGAKQLKYVIKNETFEREESISQNVSQNTISVEASQLNKHLAQKINEVITFTGKINKTPKLSNRIEYKTIIIQGGNGLSTNDWKPLQMTNSGDVTFSITALAVGSYQYKVLFRDEFGNENNSSDDLIFTIEVKTAEDFNVQFSSTATKIMETKPFNFQVKIKPENHHKTVNYFLKFTHMKVIYNGRTYNEGENIPMEIDVKAKETIFEAVGLFRQGAAHSFLGSVHNTDNITKEIKGVFPTFFTPLRLEGAYLRYAYWNYETKSDCFVCETRHYYKGAVSMAVNEWLPMDSSMNKNEIRYLVYLERRGHGMQHIATVSHNEIETSSTVKKIFEQENGRESTSGHTDKMDIIVEYNGKKIYEVRNIRNFWYGHNDAVKYISFPKGTIYYDNYDNPAK